MYSVRSQCEWVHIEWVVKEKLAWKNTGPGGLPVLKTISSFFFSFLKLFGVWLTNRKCLYSISSYRPRYGNIFVPFFACNTLSNFACLFHLILGSKLTSVYCIFCSVVLWRHELNVHIVERFSSSCCVVCDVINYWEIQ